LTDALSTPSLAPLRRSPPRPTGLDALWASGILVLQRLAPLSTSIGREARNVERWREELPDVPDARLCDLLRDARAQQRLGRVERGQRTKSVALICEAARRTMGLEVHHVQIRAILAILRGCLVELDTGEGKTLVGAISAVVQGWKGGGCHVITANDYLAERDARWMAPLFERCGVTVASIGSGSHREARREAYARDVTYLTGREAASDFLRDVLALSEAGVVTRADALARLQGREALTIQRGLRCAIVDEADSVLVDEAATPLILSGAGSEQRGSERLRREARRLAGRFVRGRHFRFDARTRTVSLTASGRALADELSDFAGSRRRCVELIAQAVQAREAFHAGRDYVVRDGRIVIVDESTGRLMPDRSWRAGLHQAIEAKEDLELTRPSETLARISFQRFFRRYERLAGMTGTAREVAGEAWETYGLRVLRIPPHRPKRRTLGAWMIERTRAENLARLTQAAGEAHARGQPVLIGSRSVRVSEEISQELSRAGLEHRVLNAVRHEEEAAIIARAGERGRITVATNMAGRGADIPLGEGVAELGGLLVIISEPHLTARLDRQLVGRCGRQGEPGRVLRFASLDDELLSRSRSVLGGAPRIRAEQRASEARARQRRRDVAREDEWLDDVLGFAGRER